MSEEQNTATIGSDGSVKFAHVEPLPIDGALSALTESIERQKEETAAREKRDIAYLESVTEPMSQDPMQPWMGIAHHPARAATSVAISLKRIADNLERVTQQLEELIYRNYE